MGTEEGDIQLIIKSLKGDEGAFTALVARHKKWVYNFITRYVRDNATCHDVLQETFIAAWRGLGSYDQNRSFSGDFHQCIV